MDIETMAQKIAELWRSQEVENHALGLSFLQSQTECWDKERFKQLLQRVVYHCINVPEIKDTAVWYICGQDADGAEFKFRITAKDYIIGGEKGRFLPQSVDEIKAYELARMRDAEKQLKNAEAARVAAAYFLSTTAELTFF